MRPRVTPAPPPCASQSLESYPYVYVFSFENLRSEAMRQVRDEHKETCRFVMGGTKLMRTALGKGPEDEQAPRVSELGEYLRGPVGLLFTRLPHDEVEALVAGCASEDFARAGSKATRTVEVPAGPVSGPDGPMAHTLEPQLRKNGMPTRLVKGVVELVSDYTVCREGAVLTSQQATLLRHFGIKMATFRLGLVAVWRKGEDGSQVRLGDAVPAFIDERLCTSGALACVARHAARASLAAGGGGAGRDVPRPIPGADHGGAMGAAGVRGGGRGAGGMTRGEESHIEWRGDASRYQRMCLESATVTTHAPVKPLGCHSTAALDGHSGSARPAAVAAAAALLEASAPCSRRQSLACLPGSSKARTAAAPPCCRQCEMLPHESSSVKTWLAR